MDAASVCLVACNKELRHAKAANPLGMFCIGLVSACRWLYLGAKRGVVSQNKTVGLYLTFSRATLGATPIAFTPAIGAIGACFAFVVARGHCAFVTWLQAGCRRSACCTCGKKNEYGANQGGGRSDGCFVKVRHVFVP